MRSTSHTPWRLAQALRYLALTFFALYGGFSLAGWLLPMPGLRESLGEAAKLDLLLELRHLPYAELQAMSLPQRGLGLLLALPALLALGSAVWQLNGLLRAFAQHDYFSAASARHYRGFTGALLLGTALSLAETSLRALVFGLLFEGKLVLALDLNASDLWALLLCAVFHALSPLLVEGRRLDQENREFV